MFEKPNEAHLRGLARLSTGEFAHVREFLEKELSTIKDKIMVATEPDTILRLQGRALQLSDLLELVQKAPELAG